MNNNNGAISFDAYIETSDFKKQINEIEARIVGLGNTVDKEGDKMESSFKKAGAAVAAYFSLDAFKSLTRDVVSVRGEFQKMEAVLSNTLGSDSAARDTIEMISNFASVTPFQVDEVTGSFIKLANRGFIPTQKELVKLGDFTSSAGKSLDQYVEAILDAQTGEFERLKEFGVKASKEGDKVTFTFKNVATVVGNTEEEIRNYLLSLGELNGVAGANAKISATMAGQLSNLEDAWTQMFNSIGRENEEIISGAISGAATLVENYENVINIMKVLVATYGSYKAAVMIATAVNAAAAAGIGALTAAERLHYAALVLCEKGQKLLNITMLNNPYVLAATLLTGLITSVVMFSGEVNTAARAQEALNKATEEGEKAAAGEIAKIEVLTATIKAENASRSDKEEALKNLKNLNRDILGGITEEAVQTGKAQAAIDQYVESLRKKIEMQQLEKELTDSINRENDAKKGKNEIGFFKKMLLAGSGSEAVGPSGAQMIDEANKELNAEIIKQEQEIQAQIKKRIGEIVSAGNQTKTANDDAAKSYKTVGDRIFEIETKIKEFNKQKLDLKYGDTSGLNKIDAEIKRLKKEKDKLEGDVSGSENPIAGSLDYYEKIKADAQKKLSSLSANDTDFATKQAALLKTIADAEKQISRIEFSQASFIDSLDERRKQYELYYKWVREVGKQAADEEFSDLITQGETFVDYINKQISALEAKKSSGSINADETNNLISLREELRQTTGEDSGIEAFRKSLSQAKEESAGLAEYLEKIRTLKEEIGNDNTPEGLEKKKILGDEEELTENEISKKAASLTEEYLKRADQRKQIEKKLNDDLAVLDKARLQARTASEREQLDKVIAARKQAANLEVLTTSVDWSKALGNPGDLSTGSLSAFRDQLNKIVQEAGDQYSPEGMKTILDAISAINAELADRTPIQTAKDSYGDYKAALDEIKAAKDKISDLDKEGKANTDEMVAAERRLAEAENKRAKSLATMTTAVNKLGKKGQDIVAAGDSILGMLSDMGVSVPESMRGAIDGLSQVSDSLASIDLTKPFSIITGATGMIGGVFKTLGSIFGGGSSELSEEVFKRYDNLISVLDQVIDRQKELLNGKVGSEAIDQYTTSVGLLKTQIEAAQKMGRDWLNSGASSGFLGIGSKASHGKKQFEALEKYRHELALIGINLDSLGGRAEGLVNLTADQLKLIQEKAPEAWAVLDDNMRKYLQTIIDANEEMDKLEMSIRESLTGISFDSAKDSLRDLILDADTTLEDVSNKMADYMRNAVASIIIDKTLKDRIEKWYKQFAEAMSDDDLSKDERDALQGLYESIYNEAVGLRDKAFEAAGIKDPNKDKEEETPTDPLVGSVQSITEETGSAVAGQITMMRIMCAEQLEEMKRAILLLSEIAANTRYCSYLSRLERIVEILEGPTAADDLRARGIA